MILKKSMVKSDFVVILNPEPGGISGPPCSGGFKYGDPVLLVGRISRTGKIKYGLESGETGWRGPAATVNYRPVL
jgi:hypothetical protein